MMIWKGCGRKWLWPNLRCYPGIGVKRLKKTKKNLVQNSRSRGGDLNPGPLEYESGVLTTQPRLLMRSYIQR
jgi:hypothetical protein